MQESRNADGTFQVRINGAARTFSEPQVAAMTGLKKAPLYEMLGRVTRAAQTAQAGAPSGGAGLPGLRPIWQGQTTRGQAGVVESRNADGTFQVRINGAARTFSEPQVAAMTGLKKGPLYEMLGRVTRERSAGKEEGEFFETDREVEKQASTELSSFYQAEGMASSRSAAEWAAENRSLLEARPYRRHPPSSQMHLLTTDAHGMALQKAMILVDHAHDDGDLTPVRISHRVDHAGAEGAYRWAQGKIWAQIGVSRATAYPLMTTVHEIGHHIRDAAEAEGYKEGMQRLAEKWAADAQTAAIANAVQDAVQQSNRDHRIYHEAMQARRSGKPYYVSPATARRVFGR